MTIYSPAAVKEFRISKVAVNLISEHTVYLNQYCNIYDNSDIKVNVTITKNVIKLSYFLYILSKVYKEPSPFNGPYKK